MLFVEHDMDIVERYAEPRGRLLRRPHHRRRRAAATRCAPTRCAATSPATLRAHGAPMLAGRGRCTSRSQSVRGAARLLARGRRPARMVGLVGRNGAGKTTLMRAVMGHLAAAQRPRRLRRPRPRRRCRATRRAALGIGYMPEDRGLVPELTVEENILRAGLGSRRCDARERLDARLRACCPSSRRCASAARCCCRAASRSWSRSARALAVGTRLLLLDEPFEGVAPALSQRLAEVIAGLRGSDLAVLIVRSPT